MSSSAHTLSRRQAAGSGPRLCPLLSAWASPCSCRSSSSVAALSHTGRRRSLSLFPSLLPPSLPPSLPLSLILPLLAPRMRARALIPSLSSHFLICTVAHIGALHPLSCLHRPFYKLYRPDSPPPPLPATASCDAVDPGRQVGAARVVGNVCGGPLCLPHRAHLPPRHFYPANRPGVLVGRGTRIFQLGFSKLRFFVTCTGFVTLPVCYTRMVSGVVEFNSFFVTRSKTVTFNPDSRRRYSVLLDPPRRGFSPSP